jgi:GT2 family glycosyltransferase
VSLSAPVIGTVILNYRDNDDTLGCLESVLRSTELNQIVIVVDNTEDAALREELAAALPGGVRYRPLGANLGYAAGNNAAIRELLDEGVDYVWVINPDVRVLDRTLTAMIATLKSAPDVGILGPRIVGGESSAPTILSDGGRFDRQRFGATYHDNAGRPVREVAPRGIVDVDYVTGACMLIDARVFETVGLIPEDYFLYFEETDFCRIARDFGWSPAVDRSISVEHFRRSSGWLPSTHYLYYMVRNRGIFASRLLPDESDVIDRAYTDLHETFIDPWREKVKMRAPAWLATYDDIIARAQHDGHALVTGPLDLSIFPTPEQAAG